MHIDIPGRDSLRLDFLILDANGTIAFDGRLVEGVSERLERLRDQISPVIITADTFGSAEGEFARLPADLRLLREGPGATQKLEFLLSLGRERCAAIGNGENDHLMLAEAALGIAVVGPEGASAKAVMAADIVVGHIHDALDLFLYPRRLIATLRV